MLPRFKTAVATLCFFGLVPAAVFFYVFHSDQAGKSVQQGRAATASTKAVNAIEKRSFRPNEVANTSSLSVNRSRGNTHVTTMPHVSEDKEICFQEGTVPVSKSSRCICKKGWHGEVCSVPDAVWFTEDFERWYSEGLIRRRSRPRKVINGLVFNHELDLLDVRVEELGDAIDHYIIVESPYTYFGTQKPLYLKNNLSAGFLREHKHKIIPITVDYYNYAGGDPWGPENYFRTSVWHEGHRQLKNLRDDDIFIMSDADEIPSRDVVVFLKHHDGFGEPIKLRLRSFTYGFYWEQSTPVDVSGVCTVAYIREAYENDSLRLRSMRTFAKENMSNAGTFSEYWTIEGTSPRYAGWHCSWCFDVKGIQMKLAAAQRDDGVRWGDIAEKSDASYINSLRKNGLLFDDSPALTPRDPNETAPAYVRNNAERFMCLMQP